MVSTEGFADYLYLVERHTKKKRGITLLPVQLFRPTTAFLIELAESDTHVGGIIDGIL